MMKERKFYTLLHFCNFHYNVLSNCCLYGQCWVWVCRWCDFALSRLATLLLLMVLKIKITKHKVVFSSLIEQSRSWIKILSWKVKGISLTKKGLASASSSLFWMEGSLRHLQFLSDVGDRARESSEGTPHWLEGYALDKVKFSSS